MKKNIFKSSLILSSICALFSLVLFSSFGNKTKENTMVLADDVVLYDSGVAPVIENDYRGDNNSRTYVEFGNFNWYVYKSYPGNSIVKWFIRLEFVNTPVSIRNANVNGGEEIITSFNYTFISPYFNDVPEYGFQFSFSVVNFIDVNTLSFGLNYILAINGIRDEVNLFDYVEVSSSGLFRSDLQRTPLNSGRCSIYNLLYNGGQSDNYYYDTGYSNGFEDGYNTGNGVGYGQGYEDGYQQAEVVLQQSYLDKLQQETEIAYNNGYADGYDNGFTSDSTAATVFSGILQISMVPVNFFLGIFNFEILGINIASFVSALLTVAITIIIIRIITGKKND